MSTARAAAHAAQDLDSLRDRLGGDDNLHPLGLGGVIIGAGARTRIAGMCAQLGAGSVAVIGDRASMPGPGGEIKAEIVGALAAAGLPAERVTVGDDAAHTHADAATIEGATAGCAGASVLVSVGSGTVADVGKAVSAALHGRPHVIVQTAASVNGFADDQSVLLRDGVKRTTATRWADRLVIDTEIVARAPAELNRAGLGDLLASYTAPADWRLAGLVGQEGSYSQTVVDLCRDHVDPVLDLAARIGVGEPEAIGELSAALTLSGIAMGVAGRTAPGSGMEHTVSHLLEMAHRSGAPEAWHGAKVGVLSVLAALLWARVRAGAARGALAQLRFPDPQTMRDRVLGAFAALDPSGAMGEECWSDYSRKLRRWHDARPRLAELVDGWATFDAELDALLAPAERLADALRAAGAPLRLGELGINAATARWALANCHLMRDRFTVADLAFFTGGWEPSDVDAVLAQAAELGAGL